MKYTKLVIISTNDLDSRINQLFGTRGLIKRGVDVEYWNVSALTYNIKMPLDDVEGLTKRDFTSFSDFRTYVRKTGSKTTLYLVYMNFDGKTAFCYRELSKQGLSMAYCVNGVLPPIASIKSRIAKFNLLRVLNNRICSVLKSTKLFAPLKYQLNTCLKAEVDYKIDKSTKMIAFNSTDFVASKHVKDLYIQTPYIVFIDQYLPLHPDNKVAGLHAINPDLYYKSINHFFSMIEEQEHCRVVIAAHPIAQRYKEHNPFDGRDIFYYKTNSLVKNAKGVICHHSTAISFVSIFKKPIIVLTSDAIIANMSMINEYCKSFAAILDGRLINMDHIPDDVRFEPIDEDKYSAYKYNYVTNPSSESHTNEEILYSILEGRYE